jgi:hypothetical protein
MMDTRPLRRRPRALQDYGTARSPLPALRSVRVRQEAFSDYSGSGLPKPTILCTVTTSAPPMARAVEQPEQRDGDASRRTQRLLGIAHGEWLWKGSERLRRDAAPR